MRFLIATPLYPPDIGGPSKYAKKICDELTRRDIPVSVVAWSGMERALPWGLRHLVYFLRLIPGVLRADYILALDTWSVGFPALCAAKLFRKKFLVRVGGDFLWEGYIERTGEMVRLSEFYEKPHVFSFKELLVLKATKFLVRHADVLLFNTQWQLDIWHKAYSFEHKNARVLENEYPQKRGDSPAQKKVFVASGRGIRYKNISAFTEAFNKVTQRYPEIELDTTPLPPEENAKRIASCYAVAVPSVSEINSNFIIEALSYGKPFITASDSGMHTRLKELGKFVDTLDKKAMEIAIEELLDEATYRGYKEKIEAFSYIRSWKEVTDEIIDVARSI
ncbi:glycosyltransferase family 4 protein [Acetobacteraceae bacterium]|nr:glycosyltransferase family 4 protein [Candidatus Parcubacteria bacterium]